jgi:hypothetical protein
MSEDNSTTPAPSGKPTKPSKPCPMPPLPADGAPRWVLVQEGQGQAALLWPLGGSRGRLACVPRDDQRRAAQGRLGPGPGLAVSSRKRRKRIGRARDLPRRPPKFSDADRLPPPGAPVRSRVFLWQTPRPDATGRLSLSLHGTGPPGAPTSACSRKPD